MLKSSKFSEKMNNFIFPHLLFNIYKLFNSIFNSILLFWWYFSWHTFTQEILSWWIMTKQDFSWNAYYKIIDRMVFENYVVEFESKCCLKTTPCLVWQPQLENVPLDKACLVGQLCPTLLWPHGLYNSQGSSAHEIFQGRIQEWVAISSSRRSSQPRGWTQVSCVSCMADGFFTRWAMEKAL